MDIDPLALETLNLLSLELFDQVTLDVAEDNPIKQAYDAIWTLLEANADFVAHVPKGNWVKYTGGSRAPDKWGVLPGDKPNVRVVAKGGQFNPSTSSTGCGLLLSFEIQIATGEQQLDDLSDVQWAIADAMMDWEATMETLEWNESRFIFDCGMGEHRDTLDDPELNRQIRGWSSVWQGWVDMRFARSTLIAA